MGYGRRKAVAPQPEGEKYGLDAVNEQSFQGMQPPVRRQSPPQQEPQPQAAPMQGAVNPAGFQPLPPPPGADVQSLINPDVQSEYGGQEQSGQMGGQMGGQLEMGGPQAPPDEIIQLLMKLKGGM
jgi:hypothetical protein